MNTHISIKITISPVYSEIDSVCSLLRKLLQNRIKSQDFFAVELLTREAIGNAMHHGNVETLKAIIFRFYLGHHRFWLRVNDNGPGFDWRVERLIDDHACHGRGIPIYSIYASKVLFNNCGNNVLLIRRLKEKIMHPADITFDTNKIHIHTGDLIASNVEQLRAILKKIINVDILEVTIDMRDVQMVDSSGIGLLIQLHNSLAKTGATLKITNASENVKELFKSMRLDKRLTIQD